MSGLYLWWSCIGKGLRLQPAQQAMHVSMGKHILNRGRCATNVMMRYHIELIITIHIWVDLP